ncbi:MAG TPA: carboxypeptidase regulatory-like domain-containing protein, partial [Terriglobia bacterium]|nr:carboxypeptidase regulatory-like domain-containing protein [Terriglobia bacterium]
STTVGFLGQQGAPKQNAYDSQSDRSIGTQDIAHRVVMSYLWELPFGKGRKWGNGWHPAANTVLGGWQVNGITTFQSGLPIFVTQSAQALNLRDGAQRPMWNGNDANLTGTKEQKIAKWFDTSAFSTTPAFTLGNAPRVMPDLRVDGEKSFDLSLFKNNYFHEGKWNVQFRTEFFNAFNRVRFAGPNAQVGNSAFGVVSSQGNGPRQIQMAIKLVF